MAMVKNAKVQPVLVGDKFECSLCKSQYSSKCAFFFHQRWGKNNLNPCRRKDDPIPPKMLKLLIEKRELLFVFEKKRQFIERKHDEKMKTLIPAIKFDARKGVNCIGSRARKG